MGEIVDKIRIIKVHRIKVRIDELADSLAESIGKEDWDNVLILRNEYRRLQQIIKDNG